MEFKKSVSPAKKKKKPSYQANKVYGQQGAKEMTRRRRQLDAMTDPAAQAKATVPNDPHAPTQEGNNPDHLPKGMQEETREGDLGAFEKEKV